MLICSEGVLDTGLAERMLQWRQLSIALHLPCARKLFSHVGFDLGKDGGKFGCVPD